MRGRRSSGASARASGWLVLGFNLHTQQLENYWMADHAHAPAATMPILVMDMYEHSYQMHYGAAGAKYIDALFSEPTVEGRERAARNDRLYENTDCLS